MEITRDLKYNNYKNLSVELAKHLVSCGLTLRKL